MESVTFTHDGKTFTLTQEEIEAAYAYQKHLFLLSDAEDHLKAICFGWGSIDEYDPGDSDAEMSQEIKDDLSRFREEHGITFSEALMYLEEYVQAFEENFDSEVAEDDLWENAIETVITEMTTE